MTPISISATAVCRNTGYQIGRDVIVENDSGTFFGLFEIRHVPQYLINGKDIITTIHNCFLNCNAKIRVLSCGLMTICYKVAQCTHYNISF